MYSCQGSGNIIENSAHVFPWAVNSEIYSYNMKNSQIPYNSNTAGLNQENRRYVEYATPRNNDNIEVLSLPSTMNVAFINHYPKNVVERAVMTPPLGSISNQPASMYSAFNDINSQRNSQLARVNVVHTSSSLKTIIKRKRKRTMFTTEQVAILENVFHKKQYINQVEKQYLVDQLKISDRAIKVWFQNRRLKQRRENTEIEQEMRSENYMREENVNPVAARLAYVESQIKQIDEYGYVTLDNQAMDCLVEAIDSIISKDTKVQDLIGSENNQQEPEVKTGVTPIYEPISPADLTDSTNEEQSPVWEPFEPNESLQTLLEIQKFNF